MKKTQALSLFALLFLLYNCQPASDIQHPTKVGQRFVTDFGEKDTLTVNAFLGANGMEYATYEEALLTKKGNESQLILIQNKEHKGASRWEDAVLVSSVESPSEATSPIHDNYEVNQLAALRVWYLLSNQRYDSLTTYLSPLVSINDLMLADVKPLIEVEGRLSWKLVQKKMSDHQVRYNLFAKQPQYYGDPERFPFLEIEMMVDNQASPNQIAALSTHLNDAIQEDVFHEEGVTPELLPQSILSSFNPKSLSNTLKRLTSEAKTQDDKALAEKTRKIHLALMDGHPIPEVDMTSYLESYGTDSGWVYETLLLTYAYNHVHQAPRTDEDLPYYLSYRLVDMIEAYQKAHSSSTFQPTFSNLPLASGSGSQSLAEMEREKATNLISHAKTAEAIDFLLGTKLREHQAPMLLFLRDAHTWTESLMVKVKSGEIQYSLVSKLHDGITTTLLYMIYPTPKN